MAFVNDTLARIALWNAEIRRAMDAYHGEQNNTCACGIPIGPQAKDCPACRTRRWRKERAK